LVAILAIRIAKIPTTTVSANATVLAVVSAYPQVSRVLASGDATGVSVSAAGLGLANELTWGAYSAHEALWTALPEAVLMAGGNLALAMALRRRSALTRAMRAVSLWVGALAGAAILGGTTAVAALLAVSYAVQLAPAIWVAYRTSASGVATATWVLIGVEALLWGLYGVAHRDPATTLFAVIGTGASALMLARLRHVRPARSSAACAAA
jgi:hypothetical protein